MSDLVLAYDLGGTKVICGVVNGQGEIQDMERQLIPKDQGPQAVLDLLVKMGEKQLQNYPDIQKGAIASAGPLDPAAGVLLDPTNLTTDGKGWGEWPLIEELKSKVNVPLQLENDAAAAVRAQYKWGQGKGTENIVMLTLGTGLGVGVIANGNLERSGRHIHPEAGHIIVNWDDETAPCGCGAFGCAEAYLSGTNFCKRYARSIGEEYVPGAEVLQRAANNDERVLGAFDEYANVMAATLTAFVVLYGPELVLFAGGFAAATPYFIDAATEKLDYNIRRRRVGHDLMPRIEVLENKDESVLLGAAAIAFDN